MTEQDDMENWNYAHAASRGTIARRYPYSYEQGLGYEVDNYEWEGLRIPGTVMDITEAKLSEHNLRNLYRRWAEFMAAGRPGPRNERADQHQVAGAGHQDHARRRRHRGNRIKPARRRLGVRPLSLFARRPGADRQ